jgi:hypothetical protein
MGTITAQVMIGGSHPNDGGISPAYTMFLHEGSRAAWQLKKEGDLSQEVVWIPTVENMLEDGLLLVALYVERDEAMVAFVESKLGRSLPRRLEVYEAFDDVTRAELYQICRNRLFGSKLILSVLSGSHLLLNLDPLKWYHAEMEVCLPVYTRLRSAWDPTGQFKVNGKLDFEK